MARSAEYDSGTTEGIAGKTDAEPGAKMSAGIRGEPLKRFLPGVYRICALLTVVGTIAARVAGADLLAVSFFMGSVIGLLMLYSTAWMVRRYITPSARLKRNRIRLMLLLFAKLPVLGAAVMAACDALDGLEDGLIDDPRSCDFDPGALRCEAGDRPDCLTGGEVAAARAIYAGSSRPGMGERIFPGYALGSEHFEAPDGLGGWARYWSGVEKPGGSAIDFMRYSVFEDPDYDLRRFDFDADWDLANTRRIGTDETLGSALNAVDPDLTAFKAAGGRLLSYHGWADALIPGQYAVDYYSSVIEAMGGLAETTDFYRLFMAPGVAHCRGGSGPDRFDAVTALERWVEEGEAPNQLVAAKVVDGAVQRTRPLCPYPQVARYRGRGSIDDAASFACVAPD